MQFLIASIIRALCSALATFCIGLLVKQRIRIT